MLLVNIEVGEVIVTELYVRDIIVMPFFKKISSNFLGQIKMRLVTREKMRSLVRDEIIDLPEEKCYQCKKIVKKEFGYEETEEFKKLRRSNVSEQALTDMRQRDDYAILLQCSNCGHESRVLE